MNMSLSLVEDFIDKYINSNYTVLNIEQNDIRLNKLPNYLLSNDKNINIENKEHINDRLNQIKLVNFFNVIELAIVNGFIQFRNLENYLDRFDEQLRSIERTNINFYSNSVLANKFRNRLQNNYSNHYRSEMRAKKYYIKFLNLLELINNDEDVAMFLWILDQGSFNGLSQKDFVNENLFAEKNENQKSYHQVLFGYSKFLEYLNNLSELLSKSPIDENRTYLFRHFHSYWFSNKYFNYAAFMSDLNSTIKIFTNFFPQINPNHEELDFKYLVYNENIKNLFSYKFSQM